MSENNKKPYLYEQIKTYFESIGKINEISFMYTKFDKSMKEIVDGLSSIEDTSKKLVELGVIKNEESYKSVLFSTNYLKNVDIISKLKMYDAIISFAKAIRENSINLEKMTIPYASLYKSILDNLQEQDLNQIYEIAEEESDYSLEDDSFFGEIKKPAAYETAVKINMYIIVTNDHIENSPNVNDEERKIWRNILRPILLLIVHFLMTWAFGNVPITEMELVKKFDSLIEIIDEYNEPIEIDEEDDEVSE